MSLIKVHQLSHSYGKQQVLSDLSIDLEARTCALLGVNGAGKTTFLRLLVGLLEIQQGEILFEGENIQENSEHYLSQLGFMPQFLPYYPDFTCEEYLYYISALKGISVVNFHRRLEELEDVLNFSWYLNKPMGSLSGGMRQRIGIAQALLNDPKVLILDEPSSGLDPLERLRFQNLLLNLDFDGLILYATHIVGDIESVADDILLLHQGRALRHASKEELKLELKGKVWSYEAPRSALKEVQHEKSWIKVEVIRDGVLIRALSDQAPVASAKTEDATLEDIFFAYCGQDDFGPASKIRGIEGAQNA